MVLVSAYLDRLSSWCFVAIVFIWSGEINILRGESMQCVDQEGKQDKH